ncbi:hypothetical protein GCM10018785_56110 [Streptomyces longispororuber]|uniref:Uncharacterized protein n=1 Tax=Streptomyces longispororuber TaxID=68230 RepID=A0A918ZZZ3_9ACTN|nr:hypothetical protein GCM10018785_56110 [Streptomyces longispororuber]
MGGREIPNDGGSALRAGAGQARPRQERVGGWEKADDGGTALRAGAAQARPGQHGWAGGRKGRQAPAPGISGDGRGSPRAPKDS